LMSVTVNARVVSPTLAVGLLTNWVSPRSACCGWTVAAALLFVVTGSNWSACETDALFVSTFGETTCAWIESVFGTPVAAVPTVQTPVAKM